MKNNDEIERTLASWDDTLPVASNPFLYAKIREKLAARQRASASLNPVFVKVAVAAMGVLLLLNVATLFNVNSSAKDGQTTSSEVAEDYYMTVQTYSY